MSECILPAGTRVGAGRDLNERWAVELGLKATDRRNGELVDVTAVMPPRQARALGALLLRQADLIEAAELIGAPVLVELERRLAEAERRRAACPGCGFTCHCDHAIVDLRRALARFSAPALEAVPT